MTILHHTEHTTPSFEPVTESTPEPVPTPTIPAGTNEPISISLTVSRQTLLTVAFLILLAISALETIELRQLHRALDVWRSLPAAAAAPTTTSSSPSTGANSLPAQVGGC